MDHIINHSFDAIPKSYLFSEVARRVAPSAPPTRRESSSPWALAM